MKKLLTILLALLMVVGLSACQSGGNDEEETIVELRYGMSYDATTADAANALDDASGFVVELINEPLVRFVEGNPTEGIAQSWESNDEATVWTFYLRESTFSDGTACTANDFAYSIIRTLTPENGLGNASDSDINTILNATKFAAGECTAEDLGVKVIDDYTLELTFEADTPAEIECFGNSVYSPMLQSNVEELGVAYGSNDKMICNGPYMFKSWTRDSEVVLVKNPNYWNAESIKLDQITIVVGATGETGVDMLSTNNIDVASFSSTKQVEAVMEAGDFETLTVGGGAQFLHINSAGHDEEAGKWLGNVNFRKALSAAVDRDKYVEAVYPTHTAASSVVPDTEMGVSDLFNKEYDTGSWSTAADEEAAKAYLAAAMEELGATSVDEIPTFYMLAMDSTGNVDALNLIADQWKKVLGIECKLDMETMMGMLGKVMSGDFDFWKGGSSISIDTLDMMGDYTTEDGYYGFADAEYDTLYATALAASNKQERKDALAALCTYFTENCMDLELTWQGEYCVYSSEFGGIAENNGDVDITFAYKK